MATGKKLQAASHAWRHGLAVLLRAGSSIAGLSAAASHLIEFHPREGKEGRIPAGVRSQVRRFGVWQPMEDTVMTLDGEPSTLADAEVT